MKFTHYMKVWKFYITERDFPWFIAFIHVLYITKIIPIIQLSG